MLTSRSPLLVVALLGLGQLLLNQPDRDDAQTADDATRDVLQLFGVPADEAERHCSRPMPEVAIVNDAGSAA